MATGVPGAGPTQQDYANNIAIRNMLTARCVDLTQQIYQTTFTNYVPGSPYILNIPVQNVGLVKRFWVKVTGTISDGTGASGAALTQLGPANIFSNVVLYDTSNQVRVQTPSWHLHMLASARRNTVFGAAYATSDPTGIGGVLGINKALDIPPGGTDGGAFNWYVEVPVAYGDYDLTGAMWMGVVNATSTLQLTINPQFFALAAATDATGSVYKMNAGSGSNYGVITTMTVTVYQNMLDQIPPDGQGDYMLPRIDLAYALQILNTSSSGFTANLDQAIPYSNFRQFKSTFVMYDNGGTLNAGTDINYIAMQSANQTYFFKLDPYTLSLMTRNIIGDDYPAGIYYISTRQQPVNTLQWGNRQLVVNPSVVNSGANFQIGYEAIAPFGLMSNAGSLAQT